MSAYQGIPQIDSILINNAASSLKIVGIYICFKISSTKKMALGNFIPLI